jgi:hypothetical protein
VVTKGFKILRYVSELFRDSMDTGSHSPDGMSETVYGRVFPWYKNCCLINGSLIAWTLANLAYVFHSLPINKVTKIHSNSNSFSEFEVLES